MLKFLFNRSKKYIFISIIVIILASVSSMASQYISRFTGYIIDYGLNYSGTPNSDGTFAFLFSGKFGDYGSLKLILSLAICVVISALLSYIIGYIVSYIKMIGQHAIANDLRVDIYNKYKGKKFPLSSGDYIVLLHEDIYHTSYIYISYGPTIISSVINIIFAALMLSSISPYLLITPFAMLPLLIYFAIKYHKATYKENRLYRLVDGELKDTITRITCTNLQSEYALFKGVNKKHTKERKQLSHVGNNYGVILNSLKLTIYIISCTVAGVLAINGKILIGEYLIFTAFINTIYTQIMSFINNVISIRSSQPRIEKVREIMEAKDEV